MQSFYYYKKNINKMGQKLYYKTQEQPIKYYIFEESYSSCFYYITEINIRQKRKEQYFGSIPFFDNKLRHQQLLKCKDWEIAKLLLLENIIKG